MSLSVHLLIFNLLQSNFVREADGHLVSPFLMNSWSKPILVLTLKFQLHLVQYTLDLRKPDLRKNLDLRKIVATTDFLVHKLFDLSKIF